jgi:hypothetical protein
MLWARSAIRDVGSLSEARVFACLRDNERMKAIAEDHSLWKLLGLALVSTRGTKLRYWKQFFVTVRERLVASRA